MEEKTLEEKLYNVRGEIKDYVKEGEITSTEYSSKIGELLAEQVIFKEGDEDYKSLSFTIADEFISNGPLRIQDGIKENYVTLSGQDVKSEEAKKDINNYNNVFNKAKEYIAEKISPGNMKVDEYIKDVSEYILRQPEMDGVDETKKKYKSILIPTYIASAEGFEFKKEKTYNARINEALGNIRESCND